MDQRETGMAQERRGLGIITVTCKMVRWSKGALRVCVDVEPSNAGARAFYRLHRAGELNRHWLVWNNVSVLLERGY